MIQSRYQLLFFAKYLLWNSLCIEYYNDLQEKGLKMKAKKEDYSLDDTHARWKKHNQKGFRVTRTRRERRKKRRRRKKPLKIRSDVAKTTARWKKIGKRGPFNIIKEILQDCGLFGLENLRDWKHFKIGWKTSILAAIDRVTSKARWKGW